MLVRPPLGGGVALHPQQPWRVVQLDASWPLNQRQLAEQLPKRSVFGVLWPQGVCAVGKEIRAGSERQRTDSRRRGGRRREVWRRPPADPPKTPPLEGRREGVAEVGVREVESGPAGLQFEHCVEVDVAAPLQRVWQLWTDLERAPEWMRWISAVEVVDSAAAPTEGVELPPLLARPISRWVCSTTGFEVAWVARVEGIEEGGACCELRWSTIEGLQSTGRVLFTPSATSAEEATRVELRISHSLPTALARVMSGNALSSLIQATLKSDLERFEQFVLRQEASSKERIPEVLS